MLPDSHAAPFSHHPNFGMSEAKREAAMQKCARIHTLNKLRQSLNRNPDPFFTSGSCCYIFSSIDE
jgi:hypothetical protein